ncbi:MAG: 3-oxoacyl-ACP synthase III [Planctomycetia bacterium]|nr:3-oxoacyl-ACP synthase III [Planctomycetia bacterium]
MRFQNVCLESWGYVLPDEVVTSDELEALLSPAYERLRLSAGRLELMTGIRSRRFWPAGTRPSGPSIQSAQRAIQAAEIDRHWIGALIHGSVCRDHLEPATACRVHHGLGLSANCQVLDVSNACLGLLNGMLLVANMIELGQIRAGIVVGTESARPLVENTIAALNADESLTRASLKPALASLTIGSGSCAMLLVDRRISRTGNRLLGGVVGANTDHHDLCHSGADEAGAAMRPLMVTDAETLMHEGIATGVATFAAFQQEMGWAPADIDKTVCHQVGSIHRRMMLEQLGLTLEKDFATFETLGNTGSVALPLSLAMAAEQDHLAVDNSVALLGIGSGINSVMLGLDWQTSRLADGSHGVPMAAIGTSEA